MQNIIQQKMFLRKQMTERRKEMSAESKKSADNKIAAKLFGCRVYKESQWIYCYVSYRSEVDTYGIIQHALKQGKHVAVPKVLSKTEMEFYEIASLEQLVKGFQGIPEPEEGKPVYENGLMLLPGLAFDRKGGRLGYGGGYYDRYLEKVCKKENRFIKTIGLAYSFQIIDSVPTEQEDWVLDAVITDIL